MAVSRTACSVPGRTRNSSEEATPGTHAISAAGDHHGQLAATGARNPAVGEEVLEGLGAAESQRAHAIPGPPRPHDQLGGQRGGVEDPLRGRRLDRGALDLQRPEADASRHSQVDLGRRRARRGREAQAPVLDMGAQAAGEIERAARRLVGERQDLARA